MSGCLLPCARKVETSVHALETAVLLLGEGAHRLYLRHGGHAQAGERVARGPAFTAAGGGATVTLRERATVTASGLSPGPFVAGGSRVRVSLPFACLASPPAER
jgi:hypothetical protein